MVTFCRFLLMNLQSSNLMNIQCICCFVKCKPFKFEKIDEFDCCNYISMLVGSLGL